MMIKAQLRRCPVRLQQYMQMWHSTLLGQGTLGLDQMERLAYVVLVET